MKIKVYGFYKAFNGLAKALEASRNAAAPLYEKALEQWARETSRRAVLNLNRPKWLLSRAISYKLKEYKNNKKLWAMAGFKFMDDRGPRDPGFYGQYHEAGYHHAGVRSNAPDHFLKKAKEATKPALEEMVNNASKEFRRIFAEEFVKYKNEVKEIGE